MQGVRLRKSANTINVVTTHDAFGYQVGTTIATQGVYAVRVSAALDVNYGGIDMGILSADGKKFLDQAVAAGPGRHSLLLTVFPAGQDHLTLVFSNYRPGGGQSSFKLQGLRIMLIRQPENTRPTHESPATLPKL